MLIMVEHNIKKIEIKTYQYSESFYIDIVKNDLENTFESWIYDKGYGVKSLMFGMPQDQQPYEEFCEIVMSNAKEYTKDYIDEYYD